MDWNLVEHQATATWADTTVSVNTLDLRSGLRIGGGHWQGSMLGALPALSPASSPASVETYVRGADLVTTHPATVERPTRVQLYWRRWRDLPAGTAAIVELIVSAQTHLLDSDPSLVLEHRFPGAIQLQRSEHSSQVTLGDGQLLIFTHSADATETELADSNSEVRHTLFRRRLEKGVILRGRLLIAWSDCGFVQESRQQLEARFCHAEPMLTA